MQAEAEFADFPGGFGSPGLRCRILAGRQGSDNPFHQAELALGCRLEGTEVPRFKSVAFKLDTRARHLEGVFVEFAVDVVDEPITEE